MPRFGIVLLLIALMGIIGAITFVVNATPPIAHSAPHPRATSPVARSNHTTRLHYAPAQFSKTLDAPLYGGNPRLPQIALTFDDGPNPNYTPQVLAILQQYNVKATFFDIGYLVKEYPSLALREFNAGHLVENHSWSHPQMTKLSPAAMRSQLSSTSDTIQSVTGTRPLFFRPPYGTLNSTVLAQAKGLNLSTIVWNDEARDWSLPGVNIIIARILNLARNGSIILLHDGGGYREQTVAALPYIIKSLRARGFSFVTIQQMAARLNNSTSPSGPMTSEGDIAQPLALYGIGLLWRREPAL